MAAHDDGPRTELFEPVRWQGHMAVEALKGAPVSAVLKERLPHAPRGACTGWGIPFETGRVFLLHDKPASAEVRLKASWLVFMHATDCEPLEWNKDGFISPMRGEGRLREHVADYVLHYADGTEAVAPILRRHQINCLTRRWGENCFEAVPHCKPFPVPALHEQQDTPPWLGWGLSQTRAVQADGGPWTNWLWAWENPHPRKTITALEFRPRAGVILLFAVSAGNASSHPLRWETRRKALLTLPKGEPFDPALDEQGLLRQIRLDMGQVISARRRTLYPNAAWGRSFNNEAPELSDREVLVEYTAHPDARFHLPQGRPIPVARLAGGAKAGPLTPIAPATQRVRLRIVEKGSAKPVAAKLHVHGEAGEYLAPVDRPRLPNYAWFEDYGPDFVHQNTHACTYVPGETVIDLPLGRVYLEISKGFEIKPIRKAVTVTKATETLAITVERVLPWRERRWVTADTHVHFLSPKTALLEGAGEGVNVVNLLASQWGELMTNVGDFDGKTTFESKEAGGGEWMVRVGTENRQHILGHISLLGYRGNVIAPMTTGGPDESALGDPVGALLTEWARQCRKQGGLVVLPHFPNPRAEHAAAIVDGSVDALEMTSWGNLYGGIDPYSLSDWYRYLNCGYFVPAVGGTDKMSANTAVGTVRTYARLRPGRAFTYDAWMDAVRAGETFVTYGPLLEFAVEGKPAGARIPMRRGGGTVDVAWEAASVTLPMSRVDLVVNGEIRESRAARKWADAGQWSVKVEKSAWIALLVRGHLPGKPEIVAAHTSPVVADVGGSPFFAAADALTILHQIEGALTYLDTVGTRAETARYQQMRMVLTTVHRRLHNKLHQQGHYHDHTPATDHKEHH